MFTPLPFPIVPTPHVPPGYTPIVAYANGDTIVVPIDPCSLQEALHNCDWEGCSSLSHVVRFSVRQKYEAELRMHNLENTIRASSKIIRELECMEAAEASRG
jgi:hypothetical protein